MTPVNLALAILLGLGVVAAIVAYVRSRARHRYLLATLQPVVALLLYVALATPPSPTGDALAVLTAGTTRAERNTLRESGVRVVALPEAQAGASFESVPDLATALRRHGGVRRLAIHGAGLGPRDLGATRGLPLTFARARAAAGLVELPAPIEVAAGRTFTVSGRTAGVASGAVELRDPADALVASVPVSADGRFAFVATSRQPGQAAWRLRVLDDAAREIEAFDVAVDVVDARPLRISVLAGSASPELKYLRRWIRDARHELRSRLALGGGVEVRDMPLALDAPALAALDLLIVDERGWLAASTIEREAIAEATRGGLGLVLRVTGPVPARVGDEWLALGMGVAAASGQPPPTVANRGTDAPPALRLLPVVATARDAVPIVIEAAPAGWWRPHGLGRVALWRAVDTHRLVTAGHAIRHAGIWASLVETVARARAERAPQLRARARVGERAVVCGLADDATMVAPGGSATPLVAIDRCAAWWPSEAGWHTLGAVRFHVLPADSARAWVAARDADATARLAESASRAIPDPPTPWPPWLALAAAFVLLVACWLLERNALGAARTTA